MSARSLHARLITRMGAVLGASAVVSLFAIWWATQFAAGQAYDRILLSKALQIAESTWYQNGSVNVDVPIAALTVLAPGDKTFYAVLDPAGRTLAGDINFRPPIPWNELRDGPVLSDGRYQGVPVRIAIAGRRMPVDAPHPWAVAVLAQTTRARQAFSKEITAVALLVILLVGFLTLVAALLTLRQALTPLDRIEESLRGRDPLELSPLSLEVPAEIGTLVDTLNGFMRRLSTYQSATRRLIGDAAHQLRTPLTALLAQIELLSAETDAGEKERRIERLKVLTRELGALVNQLVNHAMVQQRARTAPMTRVDLAELVRAEMARALSGPVARTLDVSVMMPPSGCVITADPTTLREAVRNVIDNALQYGARTLFHVEIAQCERHWELRFMDDGPGIPATRWRQVRKPFSARAGERTGASLGLAITHEVMLAHKGRLRFGFTPDGLFMVVLAFRLPDG